MRLANIILVAGLGLATVGCSTMQGTMGNTTAEQSMSSLYEAHTKGRIYVFYDRGLYTEFLESGHTPYMYTQIGAGPKGETLVYALTSEDKKKREGIPSVDMLAGKMMQEPFYGETYSDGRIYVFSSLEMMNDFRQTGEATYRYTDIGSGPNGETVVYVLSKADSKERPDSLINRFHKNHS
ncbi:hypothetical protein BTA51_23675 [Hahella sp. CCB-MM4]|uniref:hypothetical protein n=1 Tax=Hahella sp. (strain CCB-MM4) TaxID=1926491 RepID=UPI000B9B1D77|nr:hypothetical protein [Hahella sp. CCB-MM4]OZG70842.1 hypothetical protein BTA51_23675 [Hahella sp. CCB-MM4]